MPRPRRRVKPTTNPHTSFFNSIVLSTPAILRGRHPRPAPAVRRVPNPADGGRPAGPGPCSPGNCKEGRSPLVGRIAEATYPGAGSGGICAWVRGFPPDSAGPAHSSATRIQVQTLASHPSRARRIAAATRFPCVLADRRIVPRAASIIRANIAAATGHGSPCQSILTKRLKVAASASYTATRCHHCPRNSPKTPFGKYCALPPPKFGPTEPKEDDLALGSRRTGEDGTVRPARVGFQIRPPTRTWTRSTPAAGQAFVARRGASNFQPPRFRRRATSRLSRPGNRQF